MNLNSYTTPDMKPPVFVTVIVVWSPGYNVTEDGFIVAYSSFTRTLTMVVYRVPVFITANTALLSFQVRLAIFMGTLGMLFCLLLQQIIIELAQLQPNRNTSPMHLSLLD
jgi:hypothetical protein